MRGQSVITEYFLPKKVKQSLEPLDNTQFSLFLTYSNFEFGKKEEDEDDIDKKSQNSNEVSVPLAQNVNYCNTFKSPFSQFKTLGFSTQSEFIPKISKLSFEFQPQQTEILDIVQQMSQKENRQTQQGAIKKLKNSTLNGWIYKKEVSGSWPYLSKELVYRVFSYLSLRDCATACKVCRYWKVCYHNIYFCYSFMKEFDSDRYTEKEIATVFKNAGSKMKHIKKIKDILKGQKLGPIMQKTHLQAMLSKNSSQEGSLLESFRLEPRKAALSSSVFLTDKAVLSICKESSESLQFISLVGCQFVTGQGLNGLQNCVNLQTIRMGIYILIIFIRHFQDSNLVAILQCLKNLNTLMLVKCLGLTSGIIQIIADYCPKLERLDLGCNPQIRFDKLNIFYKLTKLLSVSFRSNQITNQEIQNFLYVTPQLNSLNLSGCLCINDLTIMLISKLKSNLQRLNLTCVPTISEATLYLLLQTNKELRVILVNNNLYSTRIEELIKIRQQK